MSFSLLIRKLTAGAVNGAIWGTLIGAGVGMVGLGAIKPLAKAVSGEATKWAFDIGDQVAVGLTEDIGKGIGASVTGIILGSLIGCIGGALYGAFHRVYYAEW